jgi:hypothetical protein
MSGCWAGLLKTGAGAGAGRRGRKSYAEDAKKRNTKKYQKLKIERKKEIGNINRNRVGMRAGFSLSIYLLFSFFFFCLLLRPLRSFASSASGQVRIRPSKINAYCE